MRFSSFVVFFNHAFLGEEYAEECETIKTQRNTHITMSFFGTFRFLTSVV